MLRVYRLEEKHERFFIYISSSPKPRVFFAFTFGQSPVVFNMTSIPDYGLVNISEETGKFTYDALAVEVVIKYSYLMMID
jgi:hypothetical protein